MSKQTRPYRQMVASLTYMTTLMQWHSICCLLLNLPTLSVSLKMSYQAETSLLLTMKRPTVKILKHVKSLTTVLRERGNPFLDKSHELVTLGTWDVMEHMVTLSLIQCQEAGKALHDNFVNTRIEKAEIPISDIICHNNFFTFKNRPDTQKKASKIGIQKQNTTLITWLHSCFSHFSLVLMLT